MSTDPYIIDYISNDLLTFEKMRFVKYRFLNIDIGTATTQSLEYGIKMAELNFYNTIIGIDVLLSDDQYYKDIIDSPIVRPVTKTLESVNDMLQDRLSSLNSILPKR